MKIKNKACPYPSPLEVTRRNSMKKGSRHTIKQFHKAMFVVEEYGYALRSCYERRPFQKLPNPQNLPRPDEGRLIEVSKWERKFYKVFCKYEDLFPKYSRKDFYWRLIWGGEKKRVALFTRLDDIKEKFWSLLRTVARAEDDAEAERKGIKKWKDAKIAHLKSGNPHRTGPHPRYEAPAIICPKCKQPLTKETIGANGKCTVCTSNPKEGT